MVRLPFYPLVFAVPFLTPVIRRSVSFFLFICSTSPVYSSKFFNPFNSRFYPRRELHRRRELIACDVRKTKETGFIWSTCDRPHIQPCNTCYVCVLFISSLAFLGFRVLLPEWALNFSRWQRVLFTICQLDTDKVFEICILSVKYARL